MTPDRRYTLIGYRLLFLMPVVALVLGAWMVYSARRLPLPALPGSGRGVEVGLPSSIDSVETWDWSLFRNEQAPTPSGGGALAGRFRLAGTFFAYGSASGDTRKAVLHDLKASTQMIVGEGERIGDIEVVRIVSDRVILRRGSEETELWLGFSRTDQAMSPEAQGENDRASDDENPFGGRKTGQNSWVFRRDALQKYYQEVLDDPERLVRIFDSMKAVRGGDRQITGYRLDILGEGDFYRAAGMQQGDIVRKVNGMRMTSRRRAEFFIGEFARNRANVFEMEIERNGQPLKLTYQVR